MRQWCAPRALTRQGRDGAVDEDWNAESLSGDRLTLELSDSRGQPALPTFDQRTYFGADPSFYRTYRGTGASTSSAAMSTAPTDRATPIGLTASGPLLGRLLDGAQELVGVSTVPWYGHDTFLP